MVAKIDDQEFFRQKNNWKEILEKKYVKEIENSFNSEMKELGYILEK